MTLLDKIANYLDIEVALRVERRGSCFVRQALVFVVLLHRGQNDHSLGISPQDIPCGLEAVHAGHLDIHDHRVGKNFIVSVGCKGTILSFSDHLETAGLIEHGSDNVTENGLVVD
jgi:hypothetical protein